jgi:hypothetical protein
VIEVESDLSEASEEDDVLRPVFTTATPTAANLLRLQKEIQTRYPKLT